MMHKLHPGGLGGVGGTAAHLAPVLGMCILPSVPAVGAIFTREQGVLEAWTEYVMSPLMASILTFKILAGTCGDLLVLWHLRQAHKFLRWSHLPPRSPRAPRLPCPLRSGSSLQTNTHKEERGINEEITCQ